MDGGGGDEVARPALLAYTTSGQAAVRAKKGGSSNRRGKDGKKKRGGPLPPPMRRGKKEAEIKFDEDARRDFLTGFRRRKQARIEQGRDRAKQRQKEEHRLMRSEAREERKKQAAENVKAERIAYGAADASDHDGEESNEEEEGSDGDDETREAAYNTESHHTTVTIEEFDPSADFDAPPAQQKPPIATRKAKNQKNSSIEALPPSSRRANKRQQRDATDISKLVDMEEERSNAYVPDALRIQEEEEGHEGQDVGANGEGRSKKQGSERPRKFHYETKLERAKNKAAIKATNQKRAEKRREDNKMKHSARLGGRGGKRGGKR